MLQAPAAIQQMRYNVLRCIQQLSDKVQSPTVWKGVTDKVAEAAVVSMDSNQTAAVKETSAQVSCHVHSAALHKA